MDQLTMKVTPRQRIIDAARMLFTTKGFHSTPISELATQASVSVGQIYRLFPGKDDIIVAIAEETTQTMVAAMKEIFDAVERGECSVFDAIKAITKVSMVINDSGLPYEILAEAYRNPRVSEGLTTICGPYFDGIRRLAKLALPDGSDAELDAYAGIMLACFFGLGHRALISRTVDIEQASHATAGFLLRALDAQRDSS